VVVNATSAARLPAILTACRCCAVIVVCRRIRGASPENQRELEGKPMVLSLGRLVGTLYFDAVGFQLHPCPFRPGPRSATCMRAVECGSGGQGGWRGPSPRAGALDRWIGHADWRCRLKGCGRASSRRSEQSGLESPRISHALRERPRQAALCSAAAPAPATHSRTIPQYHATTLPCQIRDDDRPRPTSPPIVARDSCTTVRVGGDAGTDGARVSGGAPTESAGAAVSG